MISLVSRTETLPLWTRFQNHLNTFFLLEHLINSSPFVLFSNPFLAHDPDTVGTFPVLPDPAGKVSTSLFLIGCFEEFAAPMRRFIRVHCG